MKEPMSQRLNIYNEVWIERLFKDRNQAYGAYQLRKANSSRHLYGLIIALVLFGVSIGLPFLIEQIKPAQNDRVTEVTMLSSIEIEQQKIEQPKEIIIEKPIPPLKSTIQSTPPVITHEEVTEEQEMKTQEELVESNLTISVADVVGDDDEHGMDVAELNTQIVDEVKTEAAPFSYVEQMPQFPGGEAALNAFLNNNIKYPQVASENGIKGRVTIRFVVERDGSVTDVTVYRGVHPALDKEALRVVGLIPKWIPGKQNGEPVRVYHIAPINFILNQ